jgi:hypothetical protein
MATPVGRRLHAAPSGSQNRTRLMMDPADHRCHRHEDPVSGASNQKPLLVLDVMLRPPGADLGWRRGDLNPSMRTRSPPSLDMANRGFMPVKAQESNGAIGQCSPASADDGSLLGSGLEPACAIGRPLVLGHSLA